MTWEENCPNRLVSLTFRMELPDVLCKVSDLADRSKRTDADAAGPNMLEYVRPIVAIWC